MPFRFGDQAWSLPSGRLSMSSVIAIPEMLAAAAKDVAGIGSALGEVNAATAASTTGAVAAGADEVSAAVASLLPGTPSNIRR
jgi:hypothetical protein